MHKTSSGMTARAATLSLMVVVGGVLAPSVAEAHFTLDYPPSWTVDSDSSGTPQKAFPCGVLPTDTFTRSNVITTFAPGQKITVKWTEEVAHDGWFRIALSYVNGAEFKGMPDVTDFTEPPYSTVNNPVLGLMSVDAGIEAPPVAPVLADGLWRHTAASVTPPKQYSQEITLPTTPCKQCILQVIQIMLNHPINPPNNEPGAGYTYHHCAFISLEPGADGGTQVLPDTGNQDAAAGSSGSSGSGSSSGTGGAGGSSGATGEPGDGGVPGESTGAPADDASAPPVNGGSGSGGGCSLSRAGRSSAAGIAILAVLAALARRRRRA
jgi:hypothetical protein